MEPTPDQIDLYGSNDAEALVGAATELRAYMQGLVHERRLESETAKKLIDDFRSTVDALAVILPDSGTQDLRRRLLHLSLGVDACAVNFIPDHEDARAVYKRFWAAATTFRRAWERAA